MDRPCPQHRAVGPLLCKFMALQQVKRCLCLQGWNSIKVARKGTTVRGNKEHCRQRLWMA